MLRYKQLTDQELFQLLKENNQIAFIEIYDRYKGVLYRQAYKRVPDREVIKDLIQDLFVSIWIKRKTITVNKNLAGYLYKAVEYALLRQLKHPRVIDINGNLLDEYTARTVNVTDHLIREKQLKSIINEEICALPKKMSVVFLLSRHEHLSHAQIAEKMNISEQTVRTHVKKAIKILRSRLDLNFGENSA